MRLSDFQPDFKGLSLQSFRQAVLDLSSELARSLEPHALGRTLNSALDLLRPLQLAMGLRIQKWNVRMIQGVLPLRPHNMNTRHHIEEGLVISCAQQLADLMLARWENSVEHSWEHFSFEKWRDLDCELILRLNWPDLDREALRADLQKNKRASEEFHVEILSKNEQQLAKVTLRAQVRNSLQLSGRSQDGSHT